MMLLWRNACLLLVALDKDWGCLQGDGAGQTDPEAPGPLAFKVDMMLGKAVLRQVRLSVGGMCLGSTWKMGVHAGLVGLLQTRGNWAFYREVFAFPSWPAMKC